MLKSVLLTINPGSLGLDSLRQGVKIQANLLEEGNSLVNANT